MKRRPRIRLLCVLLQFLFGGAIVNVAVAWGCGVSLGELCSNAGLDVSGGWGYGESCSIKAGLPSRSLQGVTATRYGIAIEGAWEAQLPFLGDQCFPYLPIWPGFAINTVFYAAVLWMLFAGPGFVRRIIRGRRGLCPACAYQVGRSDVCTECRQPVALRSVEAAA